MALGLKDIRLTVRRTRGGGDAALAIYPKLLRDRSVLPKVDICVQYLESMLGRERQDLDNEVLVHFLGDHRLARALLACLGAQYRFVSPPLLQVVDASAASRLRALGIGTPSELRLWLFDQLNEGGFGYLADAERARALTRFEGQLGVPAGQLEKLLVMDADEHAILRRVAAQPTAMDVVAHYNFAALEGLLRHAVQVQLAFRGAAAQQALVRELCGSADVDAEVQVRGVDLAVCLQGRQDAMGVWSRHGRRLSRLLVDVLQRSGTSAIEGSAIVALRGRSGELRLTDEAYGYLAGAGARGGGWDSTPPLSRQTLEEAVFALRNAGWRVARQPEAQVCASGVFLPELVLQRGETSALLVYVRSPQHATRLTAGLKGRRSGSQLLLLGASASLTPLADDVPVDARLVPLGTDDGKRLAAAVAGAFDAPSLGARRRRPPSARAA